jgi:DNA-directed RNA polymerase specialized sigma24 family protein
VLAKLRSGGQARDADLELLTAALRRYVVRSFRSLDAGEVVQVTITRLLARGQQLPEVAHPWAYLLGSARHAAIDALREQKRRQQVPLQDVADRSSGEDVVAALIDRNASRARIVESLQAAVLAGDQLTVRVITLWLDYAEAHGEAPSTRELAPLVEVSHTSVAKALARFRALLAEED